MRKRRLCGLLGTVSRTPSSARLLGRQQSRLISCQKTSQKGRSVDLLRFPLYVFPSFSTNKTTTANAHRAQPARSEHLHVLPVYLRRLRGMCVPMALMHSRDCGTLPAFRTRHLAPGLGLQCPGLLLPRTLRPRLPVCAQPSVPTVSCSCHSASVPEATLPRAGGQHAHHRCRRSSHDQVDKEMPFSKCQASPARGPSLQ